MESSLQAAPFDLPRRYRVPVTFDKWPNMIPSSRTPEGQPNVCPVCGHAVSIEPSAPTGDATCPFCGHLLLFPATGGLDRARGFLRFNISAGSIQTKTQVIEAILDRVVESKLLSQDLRQAVLAAVLKREELGSTGIGGGVAVPHATYPGIARLVGAVAEFPRGVEFGSPDGMPVRRIYLFVSPADRPDVHLRALEAVAKSISAQT